jgi:hypothetical protein
VFVASISAVKPGVSVTTTICAAPRRSPRRDDADARLSSDGASL